jgi:hypothetical protein
MLVPLMREILKYDVEMTSGGMIYIPVLMTIG